MSALMQPTSAGTGPRSVAGRPSLIGAVLVGAISFVPGLGVLALVLALQGFRFANSKRTSPSGERWALVFVIGMTLGVIGTFWTVAFIYLVVNVHLF